MANKLAELQASLAIPARRATRPGKARSRQPAKPGKAAGAAARAAARALSGPIDYAVPGLVEPIRQPTGSVCWATVATMMISWRDQASYSIDDAMSAVGTRYRDMFRANKGLSGDEKPVFLAAAGLVFQYPQSLSIEGWAGLLREFGPVWVTTDEDPAGTFAIHARIMTGIHGDGSHDGTRVDIVDPASGARYSEAFTTFLRKYEEEALAGRKLRIQIVHWPADAGVAVAKSLAQGRAFQRIRPLQRATGRYSQARARVHPLVFSRATSATASWAPDAESIDYRHIGQGGQSGFFTLDAGVLKRLAELNDFDVTAGQDAVVFALRGCTLEANVPALSASAKVEEDIPNHYDNKCVLGAWKRSTGEVAAFQASTVPNGNAMRAYMNGGDKANMMPTGRYLFKVGTHRKGQKGEVPGALLQSSQERVVLRTRDNLTFTIHDEWDRGHFGDNIHAGGRSTMKAGDTTPDFGSAGCQTVPGLGKSDEGAWVDFRAALGMDTKNRSADDGKRYVYMLLTGREARLAAQGATDAELKRLRFGSNGPSVAALQLGLSKAGLRPGPADGIWGAATSEAYIQWQKQRDNNAADGVVTPQLGLQLGFDMVSGTSVGP